MKSFPSIDDPLVKQQDMSDHPLLDRTLGVQKRGKTRKSSCAMSQKLLSGENNFWDITMTEPAIYSEAIYRDTELASMNLDLEGLRWAVQQAHQVAAYVNSNDVKGWRLIAMHNAAVRALRERFCGRDWEREDTENQEGIRNSKLGCRIIVANFDELAGVPDKSVTPSNLRPKGRASGRKARCNQTGWLPGLDLPEPIQQEWQTWVLGFCSDDDGLGAELCLPLEFEGNKFSKLVKRIIIFSRDEDSPIAPKRMPVEPIEEVDIPIQRKG